MSRRSCSLRGPGSGECVIEGAWRERQQEAGDQLNAGDRQNAGA